jgi:3-oxochol-4-en-24-oyl-CoA dehydrogenase
VTSSKLGVARSNSSEENNLLRDSAVAFCARDAGVVRLRALKRSESDYDSSVWLKMAELGWSAILVEESCDGLGLGLDAAAVIAEELGRVVAPEPFIEVAGLAVILLNNLPSGVQQRSLLRRIAVGELMPIVCASEIHANALETLPQATVSADGFSLSGHVDRVVHASNADGFLVPALLDSELALFWTARSTPAISVESRKLADNTSHGRVTFTNAALDKSCLLGRGARISAAFDTALTDTQVLTSAYLCGLMSQTLETTLDYLRIRKQFGRAIGSFQVLQHRAVDLYIARELASAVVADIVQSMMKETVVSRRAILASRVRYRTTEAAFTITRAAIQLHGAIGFTDDCDIGHYLNRAMVLGARRGNPSWHLRQFATLGGNDEPTVIGDASARAIATGYDSANYNDLSDEDFRYLIRTWFEKEYPEALRYPPRRLHFEEIKAWYLKLSAKAWLAPSWPVEYGGMGLSPAKMLIFIEEQERWGIARAPDMGITMIGPLLIQHGNAEQRERYLPKILAGENIWCQGYSEPNAGSDLASLQCAAVLDGDEFVVTGQKTWTTLAQDATHIFLLVRTDKQAKKQAGISFLLVDISSPGITIRPIRNIAGDEEFCEVFFDDVRVPTENLVGEINTGWAIAKALLSFERIFLGSPKQSQYALQRLESVIAGQELTNDREFMDRFTRLKLDTLDLEVIYARFAQVVRDGGTLGPEVSILKIWATETFARLSELMLEAAGELGAERGELAFGDSKANILSQFYNARPATIYGGSNEIQRNIVAKNVLELPDS